MYTGNATIHELPAHIVTTLVVLRFRVRLLCRLPYLVPLVRAGIVGFILERWPELDVAISASAFDVLESAAVVLASFAHVYRYDRQRHSDMLRRAQTYSAARRGHRTLRRKQLAASVSWPRVTAMPSVQRARAQF